MTVSYTSKVANAKGFGCFLKLLFRWKGSIYKLVWPDLFVFLSAYCCLSFIYRVLLNPEQQRYFEKIALYCEKYGTLIPISFVLGFYVSFVMGRWWQQYLSIPRIDTLAIWINSTIVGDGDKERLLRRTLMRYVCLTITQCFTLISPRIKKRFPTLDHLVEAGLLLENEKHIIKDIKSTIPKYPTHWIPLVWACSIVTRARREDKIKNDAAVKSIIDEINKIKDMCFMLISYDWISVPLVYTQVVTLSVYTYFFSCLMGRQWVLYPGKAPAGEGSTVNVKATKYGVEELDLYIPIFTILQFFFYMGWLKVAESLLNPFGDDDDDFELNWIIDRQLQVAYIIVDEMHHDNPQLLKDQYWDDVVPQELPHTVASEQYKTEPPISSTANVYVSEEEGEIISPPSSLSIDKKPSDPPGTPGLLKRGSIRSRRPRYSSTRSDRSELSQVVPIPTRKGSSKLNLFKRLISKDGGSKMSVADNTDFGEVFGSTMKVNDAIPELDENMVTVVSTRQGEPIKKPTVQEIFGRAEAQDPLSLSTSAPGRIPTSYDSMVVDMDSGNEESLLLTDLSNIKKPEIQASKES